MNEFEKTFVRLGIAMPYIFLPVAISSISLKGEHLSIPATTFTIFLHVWFILYAKKSLRIRQFVDKNFRKAILTNGGMFATIMLINVLIRAIPGLRFAPHLERIEDIPFFTLCCVLSVCFGGLAILAEPHYRKILGIPTPIDSST